MAAARQAGVCRCRGIPLAARIEDARAHCPQFAFIGSRAGASEDDGLQEVPFPPSERISLHCAREAPNGTRHFPPYARSDEHTSELQTLMRNSYAVLCLKT